MVKLPSLDELKKMGTDLLDSAKSGVDKIKETVTTKKPADYVPPSEEEVKALFQGIDDALREMQNAQNSQSNQINKIQNNLVELAKIVQGYTKPEIKKDEGNKS